MRSELLATARAELAARRGVLLHGPAGIGKSALVDALTADATGVVLRCTPSDEDSELPFSGLVDLFSQVPDGSLDALPPELRTALRSALLRGPEPESSRDRLALRIAVLDVLRGLAAAGPLLLVVDGLHALDSPTADTLAFALRRLGTVDVRMVAAELVADGEQPERLGSCPPGTVELPVPPLTDAEVSRLVHHRVDPDMPPAVLRAIRQAAAGNPSYAMELARAALIGPPPPDTWPALRVPRRLRTRLLDRASTLPEPVRNTLLIASIACRPTLTLLRAAGVTCPAAHLTEAERLGVASADADGTVRFGHPLVRAALQADASQSRRRQAHALLAGVVTEPVERARHLAWARPYDDEETARTLMSAAESARRDGSLATAGELAGLAARRTPADRASDRAERLLAAAAYARDAGRAEEARHAAATVLSESDSARRRVRARLVLLRTTGPNPEAAPALIEDGLRDAEGDPQAEAWLHHDLAIRGLLSGDLREATRYARHAVRRAAAAGDTETRIGALATLARVRALEGEPSDADAMLRTALALADGVTAGPGTRRLLRARASLALDHDRVAEARERTGPLLASLSPFPGVEEALETSVLLTRVQARTGRCREAVRTAACCAETAPGSARALYAAALAATVGGTPEEARRLARQAVDASEADGDRLLLLHALAVLGQAELLGHDPRAASAAVEALQRVRRIASGMRAAGPPFLHWQADLAEALVVLGDTDEALVVLREARGHVSHETPAGVLSSLERAQGLAEAGAGRAREGAETLRSAVHRLRPLSLPVDLVRTLIALGTVERRSRRRSAARTALDEALETATRIGAVPLAARARDELARAGAASGEAGPSLTPAEARIAELVGDGATNREVAAELFISVKTVEGTLSRIYRKVGVRSRTALAHAMAFAVIATGAAVDSGDDGPAKPPDQTVTAAQPGRPQSRRAPDIRR
ncbi:AAA family ATPase [Streptomyces sp. NPDC094468]|uniref:helix-turn-helix transcriptional regulator n=1 Tax=Streptomyces sp. NPDC094468 TaxID=3366066 RepID=UPI003824543F